MPDNINPKHLESFGNLTYFRAREFLISVRTDAEIRKLLLISFGSDGSLYVQFPYFKHTEGVLRSLEFGDDRPFPRRIHFAPHGSATRHLVKYSHHIDGEAHFSQAGKIFTRIRRKSFRLDGPIGHLFQFCAFHVSEGFHQLDEKELKLKRPSIEYRYPTIPEGITIVGDWSRVRSLESWLRSQGAKGGPMLHVGDRKTHAKGDWMLLGPALPHRRTDHVLVLKVSSCKIPSGATEPTIVLIGGWDHHEVSAPDQAVQHTGALFCSYPASADKLLADGVMSIDLPGRSAA